MAIDIAALIEAEVKKLIEAEAVPAVDAVISLIEGAIPGSIDNLILEKLKPQVEQVVKAALLALADKISPNV